MFSQVSFLKLLWCLLLSLLFSERKFGCHQRLNAGPPSQDHPPLVITNFLLTEKRKKTKTKKLWRALLLLFIYFFECRNTFSSVRFEPKISFVLWFIPSSPCIAHNSTMAPWYFTNCQWNLTYMYTSFHNLSSSHLYLLSQVAKNSVYFTESLHADCLVNLARWCYP